MIYSPNKIVGCAGHLKTGCFICLEVIIINNFKVKQGDESSRVGRAWHSRARALGLKFELNRAFDLFTSSLKLGSSFCRALHSYIVNFQF